MKKIAIIFLLLTVFFLPAKENYSAPPLLSTKENTFSTTPSFLEISNIADLCLYAVENNVDIQYETMLYKVESKKLTGLYLSYLPTIDISGEVLYLQKDAFDFTSPEGFSFGVDVSQKIPGIGSLTLGGNLSYENEINYSLDFTFTQTTVPYWYSLNLKNPETRFQKLSMLDAELSLNAMIFYFIDNLLKDLHRYKGFLHRIEIYHKRINILETRTVALKKMMENKTGTFLDYYTEVEKLYDMRRELNDAEAEKEEIVNGMKEAFCVQCSKKDFEAVLKRCVLRNPEEDVLWFSSFKKLFPSWSFIYICDIQTKRLEIEKEQNYMEYLDTREKSAPMFYLEGTVNYTKDNRHELYCSAGFDFSNLFNAQSLSYKTKFRENKAILEKKLSSLKEENQNLAEYYKNLFAMKINQYEELKDEVIERKKILDDYKSLFEQKKCQESDYFEAEILYTQVLYDYLLLEDEILYYKLLLSIDN